MTSEDIIRASAQLRAAYRFQEAIDLVKRNISGFDHEFLGIAYLEMFHAAKEAGNSDEAYAYAKKALEHEPGLPSAKKFVENYRV